MGLDLVVYQFSRAEVEAGDFSHFLSLYAPEKLPTGRRLREMMNSLTFMVEGFDDDPRCCLSSQRGSSSKARSRQLTQTGLKIAPLFSALQPVC